MKLRQNTSTAWLAAFAMCLCAGAVLAGQAPWYGGPYGFGGVQGQAPSAFFKDGNPSQAYFFFHDTIGQIPGDHLWLSLGSLSSRTQVLAPTNWLPADDHRHTSAPSVIENPNPQFYNKRYLMYYECARTFWSASNPNILTDVYTQICLAGSDDLLSWQKYNSTINGFHNGTPTAIVTFETPWSDSDQKTVCSETLSVGGKWLWNDSLSQCAVPTAGTPHNPNYGVGHPSAVVVGNQIQLYYYDSNPKQGYSKTWRVPGWDGVHFEWWNKQQTNLRGAHSVKYFAGTPSRYVTTYQTGGVNRWRRSDYGLEFCFSGGCGDPDGTFQGDYMPLYWGPQATYDGSIVTDQWGRFYSWTVPFVSSEGTQVNISTVDWKLQLVNGQFFGCPGAC